MREGHSVTWIAARHPGASRTDVVDGVTVHRAGGKFAVYLCAAWVYLRLDRHDVIIDAENETETNSPDSSMQTPGPTAPLVAESSSNVQRTITRLLDVAVARPISSSSFSAVRAEAHRPATRTTATATRSLVMTVSSRRFTALCGGLSGFIISPRRSPGAGSMSDPPTEEGNEAP